MKKILMIILEKTNIIYCIILLIKYKYEKIIL